MSRSTAFRHAPWRPDKQGREAAWLLVQQRDPRATYVPVLDGEVRVTEDGEPLFLGPDDVEHWLSRSPSISLLGEHGDRVVFALELPDSAAIGGRTADLRQLASQLPLETASLLAGARAMVHWHREHRYCGRCGDATRPEEAGLMRRCEGCGRPGFPRVDPAVIVLVRSPNDSRCLLGRQSSWPEHRYSTIAGFVEPGETLEQAAMREVHEETGVRCRRADYAGSQPWPFPSSLMIGFEAEGDGDAHPRDGELASVAWFTREGMTAAIRAGELLPPRPVSIAFELVAAWYDRGGGSLAELLEQVRA